MSNATPKQIAYLTYMGVRNADRLTKEQASQRIDTLFQIDNLEESERLSERQGDWITDRFILYQDLYASEFQRYLDQELPEFLHTYVRGRVTGASERLTKSKIREVVHALTKENREWWRQQTRRELFFERLRQIYPACCDGCEPTKSPRPPRLPQPPKIAVRTATPSLKGSGCLLLLIISFLVPILYALIKMWA